MSASLRTLLAHVIDYAGLFPPAKLPLDQAIRNYARYRQGPDAWMLGRFVIPAARLHELEPFTDLFHDGPPFPLALLGRGGDDDSRLLWGTNKDVLDAGVFLHRHDGRFQADLYEMRVPADCGAHMIAAIAESFGPMAWTIFFEGLPPADLAPRLPVARTQAQAKSTASRPFPVAPCGLKLRTGGLDASAFPTAEQVASVLHSCRDAGVPLKFTAGLHHPIRRFDAGLQTPMHGFINVFVAGVLAYARRLDEETLRAVIADEDAAHFRFTDDGLCWKDSAASTAEVAVARRDFVTSFGSCSFDEPRDDLRALGWL